MTEPHWIYRSLRQLVRRALHVFFREIEITGLEHLDPTAPTILASNHPNSIIDPLVVGILETRQVAFCARDGLFKVPIFGTILRAVGAVPLQRRQDHAGGVSNADAFKACRTVLENHGAIALFPEGHTHAAWRVDDLRTGTARIALDAERTHGYGLGVQVVPVGLNFLERDAFRSDVHVAFGPAIHAANYQQLDAEDPQAAARTMTEDLGASIRALAIHISEEDDEVLIARITGMISAIRAEQNLDEGGQSPAERTALVQRIIHAYHWYAETNPRRFADIYRRMEAYSFDLDQLGVGTDNVAMQRRSERVWSPLREGDRWVYALLGAPFAALGLLFVGPGYLLLRAALAVFRPDLVRTAWFKLLAGTLVFSASFAIWSFALFTAYGSAVALTFGALTLPISLLTLHYATALRLHRLLNMPRLSSVARRRDVNALRQDRQGLLQDLREIRDHWLATHGDGHDIAGDTNPQDR